MSSTATYMGYSSLSTRDGTGCTVGSLKLHLRCRSPFLRATLRKTRLVAFGPICEVQRCLAGKDVA